MIGNKTIEQMKQNLTVLDQGPMNDGEINRLVHAGKK
jgi:hypothetical protein